VSQSVSQSVSQYLEKSTDCVGPRCVIFSILFLRSRFSYRHSLIRGTLGAGVAQSV
jgi:hypothetical protein